MEILRQNSGIDIGKNSFVAVYTTIDVEGQVRHKGPKKFKNSPSGYVQYLKWIESVQVCELPIHFTMEATGVYYENLAYYLKASGYTLSVLLPNMVKKFRESLNKKSKTDKIDAKILGQMGVERNLPQWRLSSKIYRELKKLTRDRKRLVRIRTMLKNQLHAESHSFEPMESVKRRKLEQISFINEQIKSIEEELRAIVASDEYVSRKIKKVMSIPGVGFITAVTIIGETQGFDNFSSIKQLTAYAGYDPQQRESGEFKGKARMSKKGNKYIREALYMSSLSAISHSETFKNFYNRLYEKKGNGLIALGGVQRKLLILIYTLWKNDTEFIDNYEQKKAEERKVIGSKDTELTDNYEQKKTEAEEEVGSKGEAKSSNSTTGGEKMEKEVENTETSRSKRKSREAESKQVRHQVKRSPKPSFCFFAEQIGEKSSVS